MKRKWCLCEEAMVAFHVVLDSHQRVSGHWFLRPQFSIAGRTVFIGVVTDVVRGIKRHQQLEPCTRPGKSCSFRISYVWTVLTNCVSHCRQPANADCCVVLFKLSKFDSLRDRYTELVLLEQTICTHIHIHARTHTRTHTNTHTHIHTHKHTHTHAQTLTHTY